MRIAIPGRGRWWLFAALGLSPLLRWPFLHVPMISDEGGYAYAAQRWFDGRGELFHDLWASRPQGIYAVYGVVLRSIGSDAASLRLGAAIANAVTLWFVWRYARAWAGRGTAALAGIGFAVIAAAPAIEGFTANAEVFMAAPCAVAAWRLLRLPGGRWPRQELLIAGALAGVATLVKPSGGTMLAVAIAFVWLEGRAGVGVALRRSGLLLAGFGLGLAPAIVHGWSTGWDAFVFGSVTYRLGYQSSLTVGGEHHLYRMGILALQGWWLIAATLVPLWGRRRQIHDRSVDGLWGEVRRLSRSVVDPRSISRRMHVGGKDAGGTLLRLWLLGCIGGIAMGGDWWAHYLLQIAGPLAIGLAVLVRDAVPAVAPYRRLAVGTVVALLLLSPYRVAALRDADEIGAALFNNTAYADQDEVAAYLQANTRPETPIFVAFNCAAIYYLADRPATYPYFFNQELLSVPHAEAELIAMVTSPIDRPEYVIGTGMPAPFADGGAAFWAAVHEHFRPEATIGATTIYRAIEPARAVPRQS